MQQGEEDVVLQDLTLGFGLSALSVHLWNGASVGYITLVAAASPFIAAVSLKGMK